MNKLDIRNRKFMQFNPDLACLTIQNFGVVLRKTKRMTQSVFNRSSWHSVDLKDLSLGNIKALSVLCKDWDVKNQIIKSEFYLSLIDILYSSNSQEYILPVLTLFSNLLETSIPLENGALLSIAYAIKNILCSYPAYKDVILSILCSIAIQNTKIVWELDLFLYLIQDISSFYSITIIEHFSWDDFMNEKLLRSNLLSSLINLLDDQYEYRAKVLIILGNIASGYTNAVDKLIEHNLFKKIKGLINHDNYLCRQETSFIFKNLSLVCNETQAGLICDEYTFSQISYALKMEGSVIKFNYLIFCSNVIDKNIIVPDLLEIDSLIADKNAEISETAQKVIDKIN